MGLDKLVILQLWIGGKYNMTQNEVFDIKAAHK